VSLIKTKGKTKAFAVTEFNIKKLKSKNLKKKTFGFVPTL
jgi:hypothetical protein